MSCHILHQVLENELALKEFPLNEFAQMFKFIRTSIQRLLFLNWKKKKKEMNYFRVCNNF